MKERIRTSIFVFLMTCLLTGAAYAAPSAEEQPENLDITELVAAMQESVDIIYPVEVIASEENGIRRIEKLYYLPSDSDPAAINTADFEREGYLYTLLDMTKTDHSETDSKEHTELYTVESSTKDMAEILLMLEPSLEYTTEDGYTGILSLDHTSIQVEAAGYSSRSYAVSATRTYPNLSDADLSLVPKTVEENGRTLTLTNVDWQSASTNQVDGYEIAVRYTAVASYSGTASSKYATGYVVTASYGGEIAKVSRDTVIYTAIFSGTEIAPEVEEVDSFNITSTVKTLGIGLIAALIGCAVAYFVLRKRGKA